MTRRAALTIAVAAAIAVGTGCGDDGGDGESGSGPAGVAQGGAQDFGAFRALLDQGEIPGPGSLDSVGFFNEHKLELPEPSCGERICLHGLLGTMGNMITGSSCTIVVIGLNTPLDPETIERPPLSLTLVIDTSGSMAGEPIARVREGLLRMVDALQPEDRVSFVTFDDRASVLATAQPPELLTSTINGLRAHGATNVYDGLRHGLELAHAGFDPSRQNRVLLLSDGKATEGFLDDARIVQLARSYGDEGIGLSTIGLGSEFDPELLRTLAEAGGGTFYFVDDLAAVREVFSEEVGLTLVPLAQRAVIDLQVERGYTLRAVHGARLAELGPGSARIELPTLHLAQRTDVSGSSGGRRGGGGVIVVELTPTGEAIEEVGTLSLAYDDPVRGERLEQGSEVRSDVDPEEVLDTGYFDGAGVEKAFVALNVYAGLAVAAESAAVGDYGTGVVTLEALARSVDGWLEDNPDADIAADLEVIESFAALLGKQARLVRPIVPPEPWIAD
jgi:Ca-activated chloride channel family protein